MPIPRRPDRGEVPQLGDPAFDALLARALPPEEAVASLRPVVESFAVLYAAPVHSGPAAEASALTAFRALAGQRAGHSGASGVGPGRASGRRPGGRRPGEGHPGEGHPGGRRLGEGRLGDGRLGEGRPAGQRRGGRWVRSRLAGARLAVAAAVVALTAGSAVAAYAGALPAPMQRLAHAVIGAPLGSRGAPQPMPGIPRLSPTPGSSAYGLCQAYQRGLADGHPDRNPVTLRRLAAAAGGAARVTAYCAQVAHPGSPATGQPAHPQHGKPSVLPTHPGKPTPAATHPGKPSVLPTPAVTHHGKPAG